MNELSAADITCNCISFGPSHHYDGIGKPAVMGRRIKYTDSQFNTKTSKIFKRAV
jgi:hypothetical protein